MIDPRLTMRISRGMQSLGPTGRTSRRNRRHDPWSGLGSAKLCYRRSASTRDRASKDETDETPGKSRAPTAARRAGSRGPWSVLPSGHPHPTTRVARSPCPRRLRPIGEIDRCVSESPRCWCPDGHHSLPCPDIALRERGIESVISRSRAPSSDLPLRPLSRTSRTVSLPLRIGVVKTNR